MLKTFINKQKTGDMKKLNNYVVPNVKLFQKPVAKYMNIGNTYQCDIMFWKMDDNNFRYVLCFVNNVSGIGSCYPLQYKTADVVVSETEKFIKSHRDIEFLQSDAGSEFTNNKFKHLMKYWKIEHKIGYPGKHTQTSKIDGFILQLRKLVNAALVASSRKSWKAIIDDARKHINEYRKDNFKQRKMSEFFEPPILPNKKEILLPKTDVHIKKYKFDTMKYRAGDVKFNPKIYKVENYYLRNGNTIKYKIAGIDNTLFNRDDLNKHV